MAIIESKEACFICNTPSRKQQDMMSQLWDCPRCGHFYLSMEAADVFPALIRAGKINPSAMSHHLRRAYDNAQAAIVVVASDADAYIKLGPPPNPQEQLENLILWIGANQEHPSHRVQVTKSRLAAIVGCAITSVSEDNLDWLNGQVARRRLFNLADLRSASGPVFRYWLTMIGWTKFQKLSRRAAAGRNIFMAMKFNDPELENVVDACFRPAVERAGFSLKKLTDGQAAGLIDNQIRSRIRGARLVIADLTHDNNGAYFEAGFAEGLGLHVIYTCEAGKFRERKTHFDTNHMTTIPWDRDNLAVAQRLLTATIRETLPDVAKMDDPESDGVE